VRWCQIDWWRRGKDERRVSCCAELGLGAPLFIAGEVAVEVRQGRRWRRRFERRRGKVWGAGGRRWLGSARELDGAAREGWERAASLPSSRYRRGRNVMMASSSASVMANGGVRRCPGEVWRRHVQGERGRGTTATRRRGVLARPGRCPCALWRATTGMGTSGRVGFWPMRCSREFGPCTVMISKCMGVYWT
jgi:hypothetical protein